MADVEGAFNLPFSILPAASASVTTAYILLVLGLTAAYVYVLRKATFGTLVLAMYFPGALALLFAASGVAGEGSDSLSEWLSAAVWGRTYALSDPVKPGGLIPLAPPSAAATFGTSI
jgi:hypothetical protein